MFKKIIMMILSLLVAGCVSFSTPLTRDAVIASAHERGFKKKCVDTSFFLLTTYQRISTQPKIIHVYIEGDGHSWESRYQLSKNPTPRQPLGLLLAIHDPHSDVIYIARPCQYTPIRDIHFSKHGTSTLSTSWDTQFKVDEHCQSIYWSSHRYAPEVIQSVLDVLDQIQIHYQDIHFKLIGFSGGASVALSVAAQRKDIHGIITVAGDLNHEALQLHHKTSPLWGSLNPTHAVGKLKDIPQHHLVGNKDKIIPSWLSYEFTQAINQEKLKWMSSQTETSSQTGMSQKGCAKRTVLPRVSHHQGWVEKWPEIISQELSCDISLL